MTRAPLKDHLWFTYWLLTLEGCGVGLAGFKGAPDERGEVEIGYGLAPEYEGKGYMTEAVRALITWAFAQTNCAVIAPQVLRSNLASQRVLEKVGMKIYKETEGESFWRLEKQTWHG